MSTASIHVSTKISPEIAEALAYIAKKEERSKSYYVKKSLEKFIQEYFEDLQDIEIAEQAEQEWIADGRKTFSMEEVFAEAGLCGK